MTDQKLPVPSAPTLITPPPSSFQGVKPPQPIVYQPVSPSVPTPSPAVSKTGAASVIAPFPMPPIRPQPIQVQPQQNPQPQGARPIVSSPVLLVQNVSKPPVQPLSPLPPLRPLPQVAPLNPSVGPASASSLVSQPVSPKPVLTPQPVLTSSAPPAAKPPVVPPVPPKVQLAEPSKSSFRFLPFILGGVLILVVLAFIASRFLGAKKTTTAPSVTSNSISAPAAQETQLTYWGLWEPSTAVQQVFSDFERTHPGVHVSYQQQLPTDYRERLQTAIASGRGPDIFRFHASWTPMLQSELSPLPDSVMSSSTFQATFYPSAVQQLTLNNQIVGIPLMYDGLALLYNVDALRTANAQPPTTWSALRTLATQLTVRANGKIQRAGLAIGNSTNVDNFSDILALLMLQNGVDLLNPTSEAARSALTYYTNFVKNDGVWDETLPNSTTAFARGDVAMIFAPSWRIHEIKAMAPNLNFKSAPVPQLAKNSVAWASFWAEGVSAQSKYKNEAWQLLQYLSTPDVMRKLYAAQSQQRAFGEPYSRKDLAGELASDPYVASYLSDAPSARGWYLSSQTHDNGIDDRMIKYYQDAVTATLTGGDASQVTPTLGQGTTQVLRQYNLSR